MATLACAKAAGDQVAALTAQHYKAGAATLIGLFDTQRQRISAEQNLSQPETMLTRDFVGIQKALGLAGADNIGGDAQNLRLAGGAER